jgi:hypothetical protein
MVGCDAFVAVGFDEVGEVGVEEAELRCATFAKRSSFIWLTCVGVIRVAVFIVGGEDVGELVLTADWFPALMTGDAAVRGLVCTIVEGDGVPDLPWF